MPVISIIYIFMIKRKKNAAGPGCQDAGPGGGELWEWDSVRPPSWDREAQGRALARPPASGDREGVGAAARWIP